MNIRYTKFIPLVSQLGVHLKTAIDHYTDLRAVGKEANVEVVAAFLEIKMADWQPKLNKTDLLDDDTRAAAARFLAGVAANIAGA